MQSRRKERNDRKSVKPQSTHASSVSVYVLNIDNLCRGMSKLKLKINVKLRQLLCIVVSVALNGEFGRFGGFWVDC